MNDDTLLLRQINPNWVKGDRVASLAYIPSREHEGKLSVYDGDQISPRDSWQHFSQELGLSSAGVMAVTVGECGSHGREVVLDSIPYKEHAYIDFAGLSNSQVKKVAKALNRYANDRGWQYRPDQE